MLRRAHAFIEDVDLGLEGLVEGHGERILHRIDGAHPGVEAAIAPTDIGTLKIENLGIGPRRRDCGFPAAGPGQIDRGDIFRDDLPGKGDCSLLQIAFDGPIDGAQPQGFFDGEHPRAGNNVEGGLEAADAGEALCATPARDDTQADFREGEDGGLVGHPIMAGQRRLQPAAESSRVDRGDNGLVREVDGPVEFEPAGRLFGLAEFGYVRAGKKARSPADDDRRSDGRIADDFT